MTKLIAKATRTLSCRAWCTRATLVDTSSGRLVPSSLSFSCSQRELVSRAEGNTSDTWQCYGTDFLNVHTSTPLGGISAAAAAASTSLGLPSTGARPRARLTLTRAPRTPLLGRLVPCLVCACAPPLQHATRRRRRSSSSSHRRRRSRSSRASRARRGPGGLRATWRSPQAFRVTRSTGKRLSRAASQDRRAGHTELRRLLLGL